MTFAGRGIDDALAAALSTQSPGQDLVDAARSRDYVPTSMRAYFQRLGLDLAPFGPRVVHIAGTKGKGSTSTFCESILRANGLRTGTWNRSR